jgi:hypothetical protein
VIHGRNIYDADVGLIELRKPSGWSSTPNHCDLHPRQCSQAYRLHTPRAAQPATEERPESLEEVSCGTSSRIASKRPRLGSTAGLCIARLLPLAVHYPI